MSFLAKTSVSFIALLVLFSSCASTRKTVYFSEGVDRLDSPITIAAPSVPETRIQTDDILAINVTSISSLRIETDPVSIYKEGGTLQAGAVGKTGTNGGGGMGYLVDDAGNIEYPVLGKINVRDKTVREVKELLASKLTSYVKSPVVEVRITNFKVSVVGEIGSPGFIIAPTQRLTILEALAAAGDINLSGRKDNVMIIRQEGGKQSIGYIDLTKRDAFYSPYYYLKQNDIVNVYPSEVRRQEVNTLTRVYIPTFSTFVGAIFSVYALIQLTKN